MKPNTTVILVYDTDVVDVELLKKNIETLKTEGTQTSFPKI